MPEKNGCIIIGAGQAGNAVAFGLRREGYEAPIRLIGREAHLPYQRPPLSKAYLKGDFPRARLFFKEVSAYEEEEIDLFLGEQVEAIDRRTKSVRLASGERLFYDSLVLAMGGGARRLEIEGARLRGVHFLRSLEDSDEIREAATREARAVIVGGGYIGLEVAASLRRMGLEIVLIEAQECILGRIAPAPMSAFFAQLHKKEGVEILCKSPLSKIKGARAVEAIEMGGGETLSTNLLIIGAGLSPSTHLAEEAGLEVENGITTDRYGRTSDSDIFAAGDCANHPSRLYGRRLRLESVQNALEQAASVAATLSGKEKPYIQAPWFWSDQYDVKWQMAGLSQGHDMVIERGSQEEGKFSLFYMKEGRLLAADSINAPQDFMSARRALDECRETPPEVDAEALAQSDIPIKEVLLPKRPR